MSVGIEIIFKIAGIGILTGIVNQILKFSGKDEMATLTSLAGVIIVLLMLVEIINELFVSIKNLFFI